MAKDLTRHCSELENENITNVCKHVYYWQRNQKQNYKHLKEIVRLISIDSGMPIHSPIKFPEIEGVDWPQMEGDASKLTDVEIGMFCMGEQSDVERIIEKHKIHELDEVVDRMFDGDLNQYFFKP